MGVRFRRSLVLAWGLCLVDATVAQAHFLQTDPVGYGPDLNWYAYVGDDPVNKADPTGRVDIANDCAGKPTCNKIVVQTVAFVHQDRNRRTVTDSTVKITTAFSVKTDTRGHMSASASSTAENVSGTKFSNNQLATMGRAVGAMQAAAVGQGFGQNTTQLVTAIGAIETHLGTFGAVGAAAFKAPDINPMQLSGGRANLDLGHNIRGSMNVLGWAGRPSSFDPTSTYSRYSDHSPPTMANWAGTYGSLTENEP